MKLFRKKIFPLVLAIATSGFLLVSCGGDDETEDKNVEAIDSNKTNVLKVGNALISIPSPIQTAILIKKVGANYNKSILNPTSKKASYSTTFKKAINLGVYGADLGYVTIYDQTQDALGYLGAIKTLGDELGVTNAFDAKLMQRFETNLGNKDSLINLSSSAYEASDSYFKSNDKFDVSGAIVAGGWVETLYFSTKLISANIKAEQKKELINRIGEQKSSLNNLIKLLTPYYKQDEYAAFIDGLIDLASDFDGIETKYTFVAPTTDVKNKTTTINSTTEVNITDEQLKSITKKVEALRTLIVG